MINVTILPLSPSYLFNYKKKDNGIKGRLLLNDDFFRQYLFSIDMDTEYVQTTMQLGEVNHLISGIMTIQLPLIYSLSCHRRDGVAYRAVHIGTQINPQSVLDGIWIQTYPIITPSHFSCHGLV